MTQFNLLNIQDTTSKKYRNTHSFQSAPETFCRIDHKLGHKTSPNKFKGMEIISNIISKHNGMELGINHKKKNRKNKMHQD